MHVLAANDLWKNFVRSDHEKLKELEDEQEELNGSLLALTSHFAQVPIMITTYWVIWMYCRCLKRISFKNIWPQIFWVPWQGIFYIVLENSWNYFTLSRASCTCTCIYLKHPIQKEWERWPDFTFYMYISFML